MLSPKILFEQANQHLERLPTHFFGFVWIQIGSTKKGSENVHSYLKLIYVKRQPDDKILGSLYSSLETEISNEKTSSEYLASCPGSPAPLLLLCSPVPVPIGCLQLQYLQLWIGQQMQNNELCTSHKIANDALVYACLFGGPLLISSHA